MSDERQLRLVWAVEWGAYEDRDIIAVFATEQQAETFVRVANEREPLWGLAVSHRPLQLCEDDADVESVWPLAGKLPKDRDC